jgi:hypothetical protein
MSADSPCRLGHGLPPALENRSEHGIVKWCPAAVNRLHSLLVIDQMRHGLELDAGGTARLIRNVHMG